MYSFAQMLRPGVSPSRASRTSTITPSRGKANSIFIALGEQHGQEKKGKPLTSCHLKILTISPPFFAIIISLSIKKIRLSLYVFPSSGDLPTAHLMTAVPDEARPEEGLAAHSADCLEGDQDLASVPEALPGGERIDHLVRVNDIKKLTNGNVLALAPFDLIFILEPDSRFTHLEVSTHNRTDLVA